MKKWFLRFSLLYNFMLPALLLNCVGIVILQLINVYHVSIPSASWLEAFKDFSILLGSFFLATRIPKMGYKKSLIIGILLEILACVLMAYAPSHFMARMFFVLSGVGFALIKISVYSSVGLITHDEKDHASMISILEGLFMTGVLCGFWIFGLFMRHGIFVDVFWLMAGLGVFGFLIAIFMPLDESKLKTSQKKDSGDKQNSYRGMFALLKQSVVWLFFVLAFCYLFIEQGTINWLPTFDNHVLHIASSSSVEIASLLSAGIALGRLVFGVAMRYIHWSKVLTFCMLAGLVILFLTLMVSRHILIPTQDFTQWSEFPMGAYLLPLLGFLVGPIYPTLCSSILSKQPVNMHSAMTVWIVIFSALGGAVGARILGGLFSVFGGLTAIGVLIVPIFVLLLLVIPYYKLLKK